MAHQSYHKLNILVVEDDAINFAIIEALLKLLGSKYIWAQNGKEALELVENNPGINLILMDISMPVMDGITATRTIRDKGFDIPIIFQTCYTDEFNRRACFAAGGNDFLEKPLSITKLTDSMAKYAVWTDEEE